MRWTLRRIAPGERDPERTAFIAIVGLGVLGALWLRVGLPLPRCLFNRITDLPCLTCGGTRGARALLQGDVGAALAWNPLLFAAGVATLLFAIYALTVVLGRLPRVRISVAQGWETRLLWAVVVAVLAANWIYLTTRRAAM